MFWLGTEKTVSALGPLLQRPSVNPRATLLTLIMAAIDEVTTIRPDSAIVQKENERLGLARMCQCQAMLQMPRKPAVFDAMKVVAMHLVRDNESLFRE